MPAILPLKNAFEDTYGHRDQRNVPIPINIGAGHFFYGHNPDYTYNHENVSYDSGGFPVYDGWRSNESRTLQMEIETYSQIVAYMTQQNFYDSGRTSGKTIGFAQLRDTLEKFNKTQENEENAQKFTSASGSTKLTRLNSFLELNGFAPIPMYNVQMACQNRKYFEGGLTASDYPSAILGAPSNCPTKR